MVNNYVAKYATDDVKKNGEDISGMQLVVLHNGKMQTFVAGTVWHGISVPVKKSSMFEWASNTKVFTVAVILKLQEQGALNLQQTLAEWFPNNFIKSESLRLSAFCERYYWSQ